MCCFVVPLVEAAAATAIRKHLERNEDPSNKSKIFKINKLETMLWGGTVLLIVDHIINGELTWKFPFFTGDPSAVLHEILTTGVAMSLVCTAIWAVWAKRYREKESVAIQQN
jgi:hypothetical protein